MPPERPQGRTPPLPPLPPPAQVKRVPPPPPLPPGYKSATAGQAGEDAGPPAVTPAPSSKARTSGWAIASLVMGILGFTCLFLLGSILAIIFGFVGRHDIRKSEGTKSGKGLATAGIVMGIVMIAFVMLLASVLVPLSFTAVGPTRTVTRTVDAAGAAAVKRQHRDNQRRPPSWRRRERSDERDVHIQRERMAPRGALHARCPRRNGGAEGHSVFDQLVAFLAVVAGQERMGHPAGGGAPIDLTTNQSWGDSDLDLRGAPISALTALSSAGNLKADLPGAMPLLRRVRVGQSAGKAMLLMRGDYPAMEDVKVSNSAGAIEVDLTGHWTRDLTGVIENSAGYIKVRLPRDVGVYVIANTSAGEVSAGDLEPGPGGAYVNGAYGKSPVTIRLTVRNSAGNITLDQD